MHMKPIKVFIVIGSIVMFTLVMLFYFNSNTIPILNKHKQTTSTDSISEESSPTLSEEEIKLAILDSLSKREFPYDSICNSIRTLNDTLFNSVANYFKLLAGSNKQARILFLGDSQLEGDYWASAMRKTLQDEFGGASVGLVASDKFFSTQQSLNINLSKNWQQSSRMKIREQNQSIMFREATLNNDDGWIKISRLQTIKEQEDYTLLRLFFSNSESASITILANNDTIASYQLKKSLKLRSLKVAFPNTPTELDIKVESKGIFTMNALSLETPNGVIVDNIPIRGWSYAPFIKSEKIAMEGMLSMLKPQIILLSFGANTINATNQKQFDTFRDNTIAQIKHLKEWSPQSVILIVSVSNIAQKTQKGASIYSSIKDIKAIQYEIAMQYSCAFWDLDNYIEQEGGIVKWANCKPPLARSDYLHFTKFGAKNVGDELAKLLLEELK